MSSSRSESSNEDSDIELSDDNQEEPVSKVAQQDSDSSSESDSDSGPQTVAVQGPIEKILTHRVNSDNTIEFFVKFREKNYKQCKWISTYEIELTKSGKSLMQKYLKQYQNDPPELSIPPDYTIPEKIIAENKTDEGHIFLVKWKGLDYDQATWEPEDELDPDMIKHYKKRNKLSSSKRTIPPHPEPSEWKPLKKYPPSEHGLKVRPYQLEGLNFISNLWYHRRNALLADEMGLGKTLQSSIFLAYLSKWQHINGPFLIAVPLSTISHWERETAEWTKLKVLSYYGMKERRTLMKQYEFFYPKTNIPKFDILITTYEYVLKETALLSEIQWQAIIIDEAHRLKNRESKLTLAFEQIHTEFKLLLTGTPLQNNIEELWTILNFLDPHAFSSLEDFQEEYGQLTDANQINDLRNVLQKYMLRRLKGDVEKAIAPLEEIIIECPMTPHQKAYYKSILTKNREYLTRGAHQSNSTNLRNICMELRKVCNHPYLIQGAEQQILIERQAQFHVSDEQAKSSDFIFEALIRSAGKMVLLDKLLEKLKNDGHRVLIFSQMTQMLDILGDYLWFRHYEYKRLDGSIRANIRQASIDDFNAPNSPYFVFLLCTKAGGLGINLTSADTVIIYDSDWNPQNDIQATARCHRIGQTKDVKVYRFITAKSYERKMFDRASQKLGLDHAVLESSKNEMTTEDMEKLLRYGAYYAFEEDDNEADKFGEEDIDSILSNSTTIRHENLGGGDGSTFSKAKFELGDDEDEVNLMAPDFWQKYLPAVEEDDLADAGISIAERRKLQREDKETSMQNMDSDYESDDDEPSKKKKSGNKGYYWSKNKLDRLQMYLIRFGWGRWKMISEQLRTTKDHDIPDEVFLRELRSVCHVILRWLIEASDVQYPMIEAIYERAKDPETQEFEDTFFEERKEEFMSIITNGASWRLERIEKMYIIYGYVSTCPDPPEGLIIPPTTAAKPTDWWTEHDDKILLYHTYLDGYLQYSQMVFSNPNIPETTKPLTTRLKSIVLALKSTFSRYSQKVGTDVKFNFETIKNAVNAWSKKEHRAFVRNLGLFGYPDSETFKNATEELSQKTADNVDVYYHHIMSACQDIKDNKETEQDGLAEKILPGTAQKILTRCSMFEKLREVAKQDSYNPDDTQLLHYLSENGFLQISEPPPLLFERFGTEGLEGKLVKTIKELLTKRKKTTTTSQTYNLPVIKLNPDGSPVFPIKTGSNLRILSLGHVVSDRNNFHNERYIYAPGYVAERFYTSAKDPTKKTWYKAMILDDEGPDPVFRVEMTEDPSIHFEGNSPSSPCFQLNKFIDEEKKKNGQTSNKSFSISGPEFFGLTTNIVQHLLQNLEGVDKLYKYVMKNYVANPKKKDESDDENAEPKPPRPKAKELKVNFRKLLDRADGKISFDEFPLPSAKVKEEGLSTRSREKKEKKQREPKSNEQEIVHQIQEEGPTPMVSHDSPENSFDVSTSFSFNPSTTSIPPFLSNKNNNNTPENDAKPLSFSITNAIKPKEPEDDNKKGPQHSAEPIPTFNKETTLSSTRPHSQISPNKPTIPILLTPTQQQTSSSQQTSLISPPISHQQPQPQQSLPTPSIQPQIQPSSQSAPKPLTSPSIQNTQQQPPPTYQLPPNARPNSPQSNVQLQFIPPNTYQQTIIRQPQNIGLSSNQQYKAISEFSPLNQQIQSPMYNIPQQQFLFVHNNQQPSTQVPTTFPKLDRFEPQIQTNIAVHQPFEQQSTYILQPKIMTVQSPQRPQQQQMMNLNPQPMRNINQQPYLMNQYSIQRFHDSNQS